MYWSLSLAGLSLLPAFALASFENTAVVRTIELGGALVHVTTTYAVRALVNDASTYTFTLSEEDSKRSSFIEARVKGQKTALELEKYGFNPRRCVCSLSNIPIPQHVLTLGLEMGCSNSVLYTVALPQALPVNGTTNLVLETVQVHSTEPWPKAAAQKDEQLLRYATDLFIVSPYNTAVQRTRIRYCFFFSLRPHHSFFSQLTHVRPRAGLPRQKSGPTPRPRASRRSPRPVPPLARRR